MMTDWERIRNSAGPNPESFPGGEQVYLFCHHARMDKAEGWLRAFRLEAEEQGLRAELRATPLGFCLFVVVPEKELT